MKVGRPSIPRDVAEAAMHLHELGVSWHDVELQVGISRRTILRKIGGTEDRGQNSPEGDG